MNASSLPYGMISNSTFDASEQNLIQINLQNPDKMINFKLSKITDKNEQEKWLQKLTDSVQMKGKFSDPYQSIWVKISAILTYLITILCSLVLFNFVQFEWKGLAGPYRTVINQLLSWAYLLVSFSVFWKI